MAFVVAQSAAFWAGTGNRQLKALLSEGGGGCNTRVSVGGFFRFRRLLARQCTHLSLSNIPPFLIDRVSLLMTSYFSNSLI